MGFLGQRNYQWAVIWGRKHQVERRVEADMVTKAQGVLETAQWPEGQSRGCGEVGKPEGKVGAALGPTRPEETKVRITQGQGGEASLTPSGPLSPDFTCDGASIPV